MNKRKKVKLAGITILSVIKVLLIALGGWLLLMILLDVSSKGLEKVGVANEIVQELILFIVIVVILVFVFRMKPKKLARKIV